MILGKQIKTFKFLNKNCIEIDKEVNSFLKSITDNGGSIKEIIPTINNDVSIVLVTIVYVGGV